MIIKRPPLLLAAIGVSLYCNSVMADFVADSKGSLDIRNFYFSRDFRDDTASQSKREEWAQGFILNLQSGYTEGTVGVGLDAIGILGIKLDSSPDRSGTGLLPRHDDGRAADDFSTFMPTAKFRLEKSELRVGAVNPVLPLLASNFSRLVPQLFEGALLVSNDVDNLTVTLAKIDQVKLRDSSNFEDLTVSAMSGAYKGNATSDQLIYGGLDYKLTPQLILSYHTSELKDIYRRDFAGFQYSIPLGPGRAIAELRYFDARDNGRALAGEVDNRVLSSNIGYSLAGHSISGGYQKSSGDTAYIYLAGSDTYLFSEMQVSTFAQQNERAWLMRYDYDFAALGVPGLTFNLRYVKGDDVDPQHISGIEAAQLRANGQQGREWERATDVTYVVQSGPLKNVGVRWRNATNRSNFADGADENRLIISYLYKF